ncbi:MAG: AsmA family protein [Pseudomonadota bacterium]
MKKLLFGLFIFVCLAIVSVLALPSFIDWNTRRDWVERQLSSLLDRQVQIAGELEFALLPTPTLSAEQVSLSDGVGGTLAEIDAVDLRMALLPLVSGQFDLEQVILIDPVIELGEIGTEIFDPSVAQRIRLDRMTIENGSIHWRDAGSAQDHSLDRIFAQITAESVAGPFTVVGGLRAAGQPVSVEISAGRLSSAGAWPMTVAFGLDRSGLEGRYSGLVGIDGRLQGDLRLSGEDLASALDPLVGAIDVPSDWTDDFLFSAQLVGREGTIELNDLEFEVGETRASGSMSVALGPVPTVNLDLNANRLDLVQWASGGPVRWWDLLAGDRSMLPDELRVTLDAGIGALDLGGTPVRQVRLNATLGDGALSVSRLTAQLPGGTDLRAVGTIGPGEDSPAQADIALEMASGDLRRLLSWGGLEVDDIPSTRLRAFNGRAGIAGTLDDLRVTGLEVLVDSTQFSGGFAYRGGDRPGLGLRLEVDDLNVDAYAADPVGAPRQALDHATAWLASAWPSLVEMDANVDLTMDRLTVAGTSLEDLRLDGTLNRGTMDLRQASIGNADGASFSIQGRVEQIWPLDAFDVTLEVAADAPRRLLELLAIDAGWPIERLGAGDARLRVVGGFDRIDLEAQLELARGNAALGGSVADPLGRPAYELAARIIHEDVLEVARFAWPDYAPRGDLGALDLYMTISGAGPSFVLDDLIGQFGDVTVGGRLALELDGPRASFDAALGLNDLTVEPFLPPREASFVTQGGDRWSTEPFAWPALGTIDGQFLLTANSVEVGGIRLDTPALEGSLNEGVLELSQASTGLFGGQAGLTAQATLAEPTSLSFDLAMADTDLTQLLGGPLQIGGASGLLDFALNGSGTGASPMDLVLNLRGDGLVAARDGTVERLDLTAVSERLGDLEGPIEFLEVVRGPLIEGTTDFSAFNAPLDLDRGLLFSDAVRWRTETGLAEGTARLDLASLIFNAALDVSLFAYPDAPPFVINFSGPIERMERSLETDALRSWVVQRAAEALTDRLRPTPEPNEDDALDAPTRPLVPDAGGLTVPREPRADGSFDPAGDNVPSAVDLTGRALGL